MVRSRTVVLQLDLRVSRGFDQSINQAKTKIKTGFAGFAQSLRRVFVRATQFRFSTIGINSFFNALKFARQEAQQFQSALADIIKLDIDSFYGLGSIAAEGLTKQISELSKQYNINRVAAARSYATIVTAGFRGAEATKLFETSLLAQASAGLSSNNAISLLIATMKQFNLTVDQSEHALDILLGIQSKAAIGFGEFAGAFRTGGAAIADSTETLEQAGALIAGIAERTRESGSVTGTFLKSLQSRIVGRRKSQEALTNLGIDIRAEGGRLRPLIDILEDLRDALKGVDSVQSKAIRTVIAGNRQVVRLINAEQALERIRELEVEGSKTRGEAHRRAAIESQTIAAQFNAAQITFVQALEKQLVPAMDSMTVVAQGAAEAIAFMTGSLSDLILVFKPDLIAKKQDEVERAGLNRRIAQAEKDFQALPKATQQSVLQELRKIPGVDSDLNLVPSPITKFRQGDQELNFNKFEDFIKVLKDSKGNAADTGFAFAPILRAIKTEIDKAVKAGTLDLDKFNAARNAGDGLIAPGGKQPPGELLSSPLKDFNAAINIVANDVEKSNVRIKNAFDQITNPARKFNDSLIQQRKTLVEVNDIQIKANRRALAEAEKTLRFAEKNFGEDAGTTGVSRAEFVKVQEKVRAEELEKQADIAEFDANAIRRLNVQLNSLKDKSKEASRAVSTQQRRQAELEKDQAKAAAAVISATQRLNDELLNYQVGLVRASIEARTFTGNIGDLSQRLKATEGIVPAIGQQIQGRDVNRQAPAFQASLGASAGPRRILEIEGRLSVLRRESLREQLSLVQSILDRQRTIGQSFFALDAGGRGQVSQGFSLINRLFERFGGDIGAFQGLSTEDLNVFGRELIGLPKETKDAILEALRFIPEGGTVAGLTGDQIRNIISTASLGRAAGTGIADIQDLERRAAESTIKLAELNTDGVANAIQQLEIANRQLDQQKAQTETSKIQLQVARDQLAATLSGQAEQRSVIEQQIAEFRGLAGGGGRSQFAVDPTLGFASVERIADFRKSIETSTAKTTEAQQKTVEKIQENTKKLDDNTAAMLEFIKQIPNLVTEGGKVSLRPLIDAPEAIQPFAAAITDALGKAASEGRLIPRDFNLKVDSEQDFNIKLGDIAELPAAISRVLEAHPTINSFDQFEKIVGPLLIAIVEAGIEEGTFPPSLRARLPQLTGR